MEFVSCERCAFPLRLLRAGDVRGALREVRHARGSQLFCIPPVLLPVQLVGLPAALVAFVKSEAEGRVRDTAVVSVDDSDGSSTSSSSGSSSGSSSSSSGSSAAPLALPPPPKTASKTKEKTSELQAATATAPKVTPPSSGATAASLFVSKEKRASAGAKAAEPSNREWGT